MQGKLFNWLHDLAVALGLVPPMQPVPIPVDDKRKRR
ncbi:PA1414 family protein [Pseudomonas massiliensis]|nr:PA1414 family protein [Pseudomonas massiliensis]